MKKIIATSIILVLVLIKLQAQSCFTPIWTGNGLDHMNFYITQATVCGTNLQIGDEIGIFDADACVGVGVLTQQLTGGGIYLSIITSKDDPGTPIKDGFTEGNPISFRFCINGGTKTVTNVQVNYTSGTGLFVASGTAVATLSGTTDPTITGTLVVCLGLTTQLTGSGTPAATPWVSGTPSVAEVSNTGLVTAFSSATSEITYTDINGCSTTATVEVYPLPAPTIAGPATACVNSTGNVYTTEAGMTGYTWTISAGGTITAGSGTNSITVTWNTAGARTVSINYTNANSCTAAAPTVYNVTVNALPVPTITGPTPVCQNSTGNVYTTEAGMTGYTWTISAGGTITAGSGTNSITVTWNTTGARTVSVNYTNANSCTAAVATVHNVTVNALPTVSLSSAGPLCIDATAVQLVGSPSGGIYSGLGVSVTGLFTPATAGAGSHDITYTYTDGNSCTSSATTTILVNALPTVSLSSAGPLCIDATAVQLVGSPSGGIYSGLGVSVTGLFTPATAGAGSHDITYTYTDGNSCTSSATTTILVNALPTVSLSSAGPLCIDATAVQLVGSPSGGIYSGLGVSVTGLFTPATAGAGSHDITYTYTDGNSCTSSATTTILVNALPTVSLSSAGPLCIDATAVQLVGSPSGGIYSGLGVSVTGLFTPATAGAGSHDITYTYTDGNSCTSSATTTILVNALPTVSLSSAGPLCIDATAVQLVGSPSGGIYSGLGVSVTGLFTPATAGAGSHDITYTYTDGNSCTSSATTTILVNALPTVSLSSAGPLCIDATAVQLVGSPSGGIYSGLGVSVTGLFTPATAGAGSHDITYTYTDGNSCTSSATTTILVNALPTVSLSSAGPLCIDATAVQLVGSPSGGIYSGLGVSVTGLFTPATAGAGSHDITYTYTDGNSCTSSATTTILVNALPTVSLSSAGPLCIDATAVQLVGSPSGGIYSGLGVSVTGLFTPATAGAGSHDITYTYTDGNSCTSSATTTILVNALPTVSLSSAGPLCIDATAVQLVGSPSGGIYSGLGVSVTGLFTPATAGAGSHDITYTYTDGNSCTSSATTTILVNALPTVSLSSAGPLCIDATAVQLVGSPSGGIYSGLGVSVTGLFTPATAGAGSHDITYTYTDGNSCTSSATTTILVNALPTVSLSSAGPLCIDATAVQLVGSPSGGIYSGLGVSVTGLFTPATAGAGSHDITYTYTDGNSCTSSATTTILVNALPTVSLSSAGPLCIDATAVQLVGSPSGGIYSGLGVSVTGLFTPATAGAGSHDITYTYTDGNSCTSSATTTILVNALPTVSLSSAGPLCIDATAVQLVGSPSGGIYSGLGVSVTGLFTPATAGAGSHDITYTYTDGNSCTSSATTTILVNALPTVSLSSAGPLCIDATAVQLVGSPSGGIYSGLGVSVTGLFTPATAGAGSHDITYTYTDGNSCTSSATTTILVNALPTVSLSSAGPLCIDATAVQLVGSPSGGIYSGLGVSVTGLFTPATAGAGSHDITYTYTDGNSCTSSATTTILVNALPTVILSSAGPLCIDATAVQLVGSPSGGIYSGLGVSVTGLFTPATAGAGSHDITYTYTDGNSCTSSATTTILVNALPTVSLSSAAGTNSQTVCISTPVTSITYVTTGATGATVTGLPTGVTGNWASNTVTISGTPTVSGPFSYTVTLTGGCGTITANGSITVTPNNTVTLTSAASTNSQTVCISTTITNITYTTTGATGATFSGLPTGVTGNWAADLVTISGTPSSSGTFNYTVTLTGGCGTVSATGTITVTADMIAGSASSTPTLCINTLMANITHATTRATGIGTATGLPAGVTAAWASNTITISGTPTASGVFNYSIPLTGGCGTVSATGTITVTADMIAGSASSTPTLCIHTALANITHATTRATGTGTATGLPAGVTAAWASNTITISGTPTASGTFNYSIPLTGGCGTVIATGTITVIANNTAILSSGVGTDTQTKCINTAITSITYTTTGATGATFSGLPTGVTGIWASNTVTISGTPTVSGTFNYTVNLTGGCGVVTKTGTITVNALPVTSNISGNPTPACNGIGVIYNVTLTPGSSYLWTVPPGSTITSGATGPDNNQITVNFGTTNGNISVTETNSLSCVGTPKTLAVSLAGCNLNADFKGSPLTICMGSGVIFTSISTGTSGSTTYYWNFGSGASPATANTIGPHTVTYSTSGLKTITLVLTDGVSDTEIKSDYLTVTPNVAIAVFTPATSTRCQGSGTVIYTTTATNPTGITYSLDPASLAGGNTIVATTGAVTYSPTWSGTTTITATATGCNGPATTTHVVTVNALPTPTVTGPTPVCQNSTGNVYTTEAGMTGYTWTISAGGSITAGSGTNSITVTWNTSGAQTVSVNYNNANNCSAASPTVYNVTVNPLPVPIITGPTSVCQNSTGNVYTTEAGMTGYTWTISAGGTITAGSGTNSITVTWNTAGAQTVSVNYGNANGCTAASPIIYNVTVTPNNTITLTSAPATMSQTVCISTPVTSITYGTTGATGATVTGLPAGVTGNWVSNVVTISGTPTVSGPFSYTVTLTGGCGTITANGTITVTPVNTITLTSAAGTNSQTVCISTAITNITYTTTGATGATFSGLPAGVTGNWTSNVVTISGTPTASGPFTYTVTLTGGCGVVTTTGSITVTPNNTVTLTSAPATTSQTVCISTPVTSITYGTTGATGATVTGLPAGVTGNWASNTITISGTPSASGTFNYTVTLTGGCGTITANGSITVTPNNTVTLTSAAGTNSQTVCISTAITNITYSTTGATGATITGLPTGVTGIWASNVLTISGTPTVAGSALTYTVTLTGGCGNITTTGTIAVTANNTIALTSAAGTNSQTVCISTAITNITYTTTGATGATVTGLPAGVTGNWASNVVTISGTPTVSGPFNYTVTLTGGCGTITANGSITVTPNNTVTLTSAAGTNSQTVCISTAITNITYTTTGATGATVTGLPAGVTGNWASNVVTISGTPTASGPFTYTITLTGGCGVVTTTGSITVTPNNTVTLTSAPATTSQTVCISTPVTSITYGTTGATGATVTGLPAGVTGNWASNTITISGTPSASGTFNYTVTLTGGCGTITANGSITVTPNNTVTLTSAAGTNSQTVCISTAITNITYTTTGATGATFSGLPTGVTGNWASNVVTISGTPTVSGSALTYTVTLTGGCGVVTTTGTITVTANNTVNRTSALGTDAQTVCINTTITPITYSTTGATGANVTGLPTGVTGVWASNVLTISGTPTVAGSALTFTVTLTGGCGVVTTTGSITVTPNNTVTLTSAPATMSQTVCISTPVTSITYGTTGATGATVTGLPAGVTGNWASNVVTISGTPTVSGPFSYTVTLTGGCGTITANGTITVTPVNTITLTSAAGTNSQTVCISTAITNITYTTTGATGATFSGLPTGVTGNWTSNVVTISGTPTASGPFTYTVTLTGGCGVVTTTGSITVTPNNTVTLTSAPATTSQTVCISTPVTSITYGTTGAMGATVTGLPAGVTGNWASNTITISGTPSASGTFNYTVTLTGGCGTITANGSITVTPNNTVTLTSAAGTNSQTVCISTAITNITYSTTGATGATITGLPTGVTGIWASNVLTISGTPTVAGSALTYTVTLTGGCGNITTTGTIAVTANNTIALTSAVGTNAQTKCINTAITSITYSTTGATGATLTGLPTGITGVWASNIVSISGTPTASGPFSYTVTLTGGCGTVTANGTITVTPVNTIALTSAGGTNSQTVCISTPVTSITYGTTGATGATVTGLPTGVTGNWASNTVTISGTPTVSGPFSYTVTLTGGCGTITANGSITVTPNNTVTLTSAASTNSQTVCISTTITNITYTTTGATGATFNGLPTGVTGNWAADLVTISGTPSSSGTFNYTVTLTGGCGTVSATGTITVTADMIAGSASSTPTLCINTLMANITHATTRTTGIGTATGLPAGVTAAWASNTITISGTPTASGVFNYSIPLTGGCGTVSATGTITVTADMIAGSASSNPTLCINTALANITHATTRATGIGTATGLPAGVTAAWASNTITISGTPTASGVFNYSIPLTGGCGSVNATGTITVTADMITGSASSTPTLCINTALANITHATTRATGIGTATGLPAGVTAAWASNTITISGTPTASGVFNYSIPLTGGCGTVSATGTITVTADMIAGSASSTPTLCINTALANITHATTRATGIGTATGLPAGVTAAWASNTITISGTPTTSGVFNYSIPLTGGCGTVSATGTITVTADMIAGSASSTPTLCINTTLANITHATARATGIGTATGLPAGVTAAFASNTITISGTPTASGVFNYSIPLTGGCGIVSATGTITVTADMIAGSASSTPTLCINTALANITHATTRATGIGTATGLPAGVTAAWASNTITISGTPTTSGVFNYSIPLTGGCGTVSATGTITVTADMIAGSASSTPTLCINTALINITHATTRATGIGTATGLPAGVTAAWASNTITISGTPTASGVFNYSIPLTGGCGTVSATGTITVTADMIAGSASSTPTLCINTALANITHATTRATGTGTATGLPAGVTAAWASNTITISGTPTASGVFNYSIPLTGGCGTVIATGTITVIANNTAILSSAVGTDTQTKCINTAITSITYTTTGATGATFSGLPTGVTGIWASNTVTISGTPTVSGTFNYTVNLTGGCGVVTKAGTITVNALPVTSNISGSLTPACNGIGVIYNVTLTPGSSYLWTVPPGSSITSGATGPDNNQITVNFGTTNGNISVTETNSLSCVGTPKTLAVSLAGCNLNANFTGSPLTICMGSGVIFTSISNGTSGSTTYYWNFGSGASPATANTIGPHTVTYSTSGLKTITLVLTDGVSDTEIKSDYLTVTPNVAIAAFTPATSTRCQGSGTVIYTTTATNPTGITYSLDPASLAGGNTIVATTGAVTYSPTWSGTTTITATATGCNGPATTTHFVTVNALPVPAITGSSSVCAASTGNVYSTTAGMTNYAWAISAGGTITAGGTSTSNTVTVTWNTSGAQTVSVNYNNANNCSAASPTVYSVTVNPLPVPIITGSSSVCAASTGNIYSTTAGMTNYVWAVSAGGTITAGGTSTSNTVTVTWNTSGAQTVSVNYTNANSCTAASPTVYNVTVNALPTPTITGPAAACVNSTGNVYSTQTGMTNYAWAVSAGGTITAGGTSTSNTMTVTWATTGARTVSVSYTNTNNCTAASPSVYNVTVNALPTPTIAGPAAACVNSTGNVYTTQAGMTNYAWAVSAGGTITAGGTSTSNTVTVTWNTAGPRTVSVNYTNSNSCTAAAPTVYNVTINALPVPTVTGPTPVCQNSTGNVYTTEAGMTGYTWTISAGGSITAGAGTNSITVTWNTSGAQTVSVNYTNSNSCTASTATTKSITVNPLPVPTITGPTPVCQNSTGNVYTTEAGMTGYTWTMSAGGTITAGSGTNSIIVMWNTSGARTVSVTYTNANSCTAAAATVYNVTVNALPIPTITGLASVCVNSTGNVYSTTAGMTNYVWAVSTGGTITAGGGTGNNTVIVTWTTAGARTVSLSYTNTNNCTAASPTVYNVTVNALPIPVITGSATVCAGSTSNVYSTTSGMTNYAWLVSAGGTITAGGTSTSNTVTVTWNTSGAQTVSVNYTNANSCTAASPTVYNVTVNALPTITGTTPASRCGTGTVVLAATASAGTINWYSTFTGGTSDGTGPTFITPSITSTKTYYVDATNNSCTSTPRTPVVATVILIPSAAGSITGPATYTPGTNGIPYSVAAIPEATSYIWAYTGNGVTIHGTGTNVTLDFSSSATGGQLTVKGHNSCYDGLESTLGLSPNPKTLNITVFLEGLYNGSGGMVKVQGCTDGENSFDMFSGTISDTLTVQIAQINDPYLILYTVHGVPINTDGTINLNAIPGTFTNSYYIIIKHRNHIETWSQIVSFTGQIISYNFTDAVSKAWGNNMIKIGSAYCIYTGDVNKDQYVDGFDIVITFNLNKLGSFGYQVSDINGDGFVDGFDLVKVFNNNKKGVGMNTPAAPMKKKK